MSSSNQIICHLKSVAVIAGALMAMFDSRSAFGDSLDKNIQAIRDIYSGCTVLEKRTDAAAQIKLQHIISDPAKDGVWQREKSGAKDVYDTAVIFKKSKTIKFIKLSDPSLSGDWSLDSEFCFRDNGKLAFEFSNLRTFHGDVRVETRIYFDESNHEIRKIEDIFDLKSDKKLKANDERRDQFERRLPPKLDSPAAVTKYFGGLSL